MNIERNGIGPSLELHPLPHGREELVRPDVVLGQESWVQRLEQVGRRIRRQARGMKNGHRRRSPPNDGHCQLGVVGGTPRKGDRVQVDIRIGGAKTLLHLQKTSPIATTEQIPEPQLALILCGDRS